MDENFFAQTQQQLGGILQQLSSIDLTYEERRKLVGKAQAFLGTLENEYINAQQQLHDMKIQCNRMQSDRTQMQSTTPGQLALQHYRLIHIAGGDADLIYRVAQQAEVDLIERLKILRTLFGYSLDEARAVEARNN